jgi:hypothetical protein
MVLSGLKRKILKLAAAVKTTYLQYPVKEKYGGWASDRPQCIRRK